jgi:hypothetical protein
VLLDVARNFTEVILLVMITDMFNGVYISHGYILTSIFVYVLYLYLYLFLYYITLHYTIFYLYLDLYYIYGMVIIRSEAGTPGT